MAEIKGKCSFYRCQSSSPVICLVALHCCYRRYDDGLMVSVLSYGAMSAMHAIPLGSEVAEVSLLMSFRRGDFTFTQAKQKVVALTASDMDTSFFLKIVEFNVVKKKNSDCQQVHF